MKKWFWTLPIVMTITLLALMFMQYIWIKSALQVREHQFSQMVRQALYQIVNDLEMQETWTSVSDNFILNKQNSSGMKGSYYIQSPNDTVSISYQFNGSKPIVKTNRSANVYVWNDSLKNYVQVSEKQNNKRSYFINPKTGRMQVVGADSASKAVILQSIVDQMSRVSQKPLEQRFKSRDWEYIIHRDLMNNGIPLDFEFAVCNDRNQFFFHSKKFPLDKPQESYRAMLFRNDLLHHPYFLHLYFPKKTKALLGTFKPIAFSSVALILIVMAVFTLTLFIIFRQKKLSEMKNDFVNNMTHELKTPISTVLLATQMLKDDSIPIEVKNTPRLSQLIEDETKRLQYQVEKILQMAAFDKGHVSLKLKEVDVNPLIEHVTQNFRINVQNKGGSLLTELDNGRSVIKADEHHLQNVIFNLLDNAVKYSGNEPKITIKTHATKNFLEVSVSDNGIGMTKDDQNKIFEEFYRVHTGNRHDVKGFGLGLSYVRKVVEQHGGSIKVDSMLNVGTSFKILLPYEKNNKNT